MVPAGGGQVHLGERGEDRRGPRAGAGVRGARQEHEPLVAAHADEDVPLADVRAGDLGEGPQRLVTDRVAIGVVEGLEVVEVDGDDGDVGRPRAQASEVALEEPPVARPGQRVGEGLMLGDLEPVRGGEGAAPRRLELRAQQRRGSADDPGGGGQGGP